MSEPALGAWVVSPGQARFRVWAPGVRSLGVALEGRAPVPLTRVDTGYWSTHAPAEPGDRYRYVFPDGVARPDPVSMSQPEGVHGPSAVVAPGFAWTDAGFRPAAVTDWVVYELHVGTFTDRRTFAGVIPHLRRLAELGITTLQLMPVAEFAGARNWGYDGVFPWAAHHAYGGLDGLRALVDACHGHGLAVALDVVYNHLGPEGNVLGHFGPYFTDRYRTPWGSAVNFDGPGSDAVREYFVENARFWAREAHIDALRLDAVHAIFDATAYTFLEELSERLRDDEEEIGRRVVLIAESADNDSLLTAPSGRGGRGYDAQWSDDFHHALHVSLTGERSGYYGDFDGVESLATAFEHGFVYRGQHSSFRGRRHGRHHPEVALDRLIAYGQNHDQVGNRPMGERLVELVGFEGAKVSLACTLLAPSIPMLFMGEEHGARAPFPYFVSHTDPELVEAVRRGRAAEFPGFPGVPPDPHAETTFFGATIDPAARGSEGDGARKLCRDLLEFRRSHARLRPGGLPVHARADAQCQTLLVTWGPDAGEMALVICFATEDREPDLPEGTWVLRLDTASTRYGGPGGSDEPSSPLAPSSARLLERVPDPAR